MSRSIDADPNPRSDQLDLAISALRSAARVLPMTAAATQAFDAARRDVQATFDIIAQRQAMEAAQIGIWAFDARSGSLHCDERCRALLGLSATASLSYEIFLQSVHPADAPAVKAAIRNALKGAMDGCIALSYRSIGIDDKTERWLSANGRCSFDPGGRACRFTGTLLDLSKQHAAEAERAAHVEELEHNLHLDDLFAGILGHDLRNPLGAIAASAELLRRRADSDRAAAPAERILASAARMSRMIEQLLDFTRIRLGGGLPLCVQPVDLAELCQQVSAELAAGGKHQPLRLTRSGNTGGEWDRDRLWQLLENIIGNALHHGAEGKPVYIHLDGGRDAEVCLDVVNQGSVPQTLQTVMFEPLRSVSKRARTGSSGLGLGLFISRQIALAHGGNLAMNSGPARQTRLSLRLPRRSGASGGIHLFSLRDA